MRTAFPPHDLYSIEYVTACISDVQCGDWVAQLVERQTEDLKVPGSSPPMHKYFL